MFLYEISTNVVDLIPYRNFKDKIIIVKQELYKNRHVEIMDKYIYSERRRTGHAKFYDRTSHRGIDSDI